MICFARLRYPRCVIALMDDEDDIDDIERYPKHGAMFCLKDKTPCGALRMLYCALCDAGRAIMNKAKGFICG